MKKVNRLLFIILIIALAAFTGCNKQNETTVVSSEDEINTLTDQAIKGFENQEVYSDEPEKGIYMQDNGIPPDFLVEETDLEGKDTLRKYICDHSFIECLRGLNLTETQKSEIKKGIREYRDCKEDAVNRAKAIYRELVEKYKIQFERFREALKNGTISKEKFKELVTELKIEFRRELHGLQLKEKIHDAFKTCFRSFLNDLHSILTERQWKAFVECNKR